MTIVKGFFTSEFFLTLVGSILAPGSVVYLLHDKLNPQGLSYTIVGAALAAAVPIYGYIKARTALKIAIQPGAPAAAPVSS